MQSILKKIQKEKSSTIRKGQLTTYITSLQLRPGD